jgi:membrane protein
MSTVLGESTPTRGSTAERGPRRRSPWFVVRRTFMEFFRDDGVDVAAALAFFGLLSILPALITVVGLVAVTGQTGALTDLAEAIGDQVLQPEAAAAVRDLLDEVIGLDGPGLTLSGGLVGLLWTASIYVNGFGRALNRIYEVDEGRPFWRLRPLQVGVTLILLLVLAAGLVIVLVTGPVAQVVGNLLGVGDDLVAGWDVAKWPVLGLLVVLLVAMLLHLTPNVRFERFRLITLGSFTAILVIVAGSVGFGFYVTRLGSFSTYGALAGLVVLGLWLWLANMALIFGAELDAEIERGRQLRLGHEAEARMVLPTRSDKVSEKKRGRDRRDEARMRAIREAASGGGDPDDRPFDR